MFSCSFFLSLYLSRVCGGDPLFALVGVYAENICPAYAGVIPAKFDDLENSLHLSRVCGGDPNVIFVEKVVTVFVPRMRG